jgi:hypothetical protein
LPTLANWIPFIFEQYDMADRKWNNQGGSSRDGGRSSKGRAKKIPDPFKTDSINDLKESEITSFKLVRQRKPQPDYGQFKDAIWIPDEIIDDDPIRDLDDPYRLPDLSPGGVKDVRPFPINENIKRVPFPTPNQDLPTENKSKDLLPYSVKDEYELIVKFKKVVLTISSGQAFAARNRINDAKLDRAIVIQSTQPIVLNTSIFLIEQNTTPRTVNILQLANGVQDPIWSLYNWMLTKRKIVTDNSGTNSDDILMSLDKQSDIRELPKARFTYDNKEYGLFYEPAGLQPYQICMHARNDVLKFVAGNPRDDRYWSVLYANMPVPLCVTNVPTVSIRLAVGSASELEAGSGMSFVLDVSIYPVKEGDTLVEYEILGDALPSFYSVNGVTVDTNGVPVVRVPASGNKEISIEPFLNTVETENRTIIFKLKESDRYEIDEESVTLTILPKVNADIFLLKITPILGGLADYLQPRQAKLYGSNTRLTTIEVDNLVGVTNPDYTRPKPVGITEIVDGLPPTLFSEYNYPDYTGSAFPPPGVQYSQLNLNDARSIAERESFRYLYFFTARWEYSPDDRFSDNFYSYATISAQIVSSTLETVPPTPADLSQPYKDGARSQLGYVDWNWVDKWHRTGRLLIQPYTAIMTGACVQIDTQDFSDITFLSPFSTDIIYTTGGSLLNLVVTQLAHRDVIVNP